MNTPQTFDELKQKQMKPAGCNRPGVTPGEMQLFSVRLPIETLSFIRHEMK